MQTTITIRKIYTSTGTSKFGKPWTLTKLMDAKKQYYSAFDNKLKLPPIQEGDIVTLEAEPSDKPEYFNITKVLEIKEGKPRSSTASTTGGAGHSTTKPPQSSPADAPPSQSRIVEERLSEAKAILKRQVPRAEEYSEYNQLLTEIFRQLSSEQWLEIEKRKMK
ncbi:MAG: hypothetical protein KGH64_06315 [Candidatus Micrarchaeota archaeon]|nr:hypothetical protein [Candidatus Micrarchaeota archaeon]